MRDAGRYTCEVLDRAGRSEKHYNLNVWGEGLGGWAGVLPLGSLPARSAMALMSWGVWPWPVPGYSPSPSLYPHSPAPSCLLPHTPLLLVPPAFPSPEPRTLTVTKGYPARLSCECRGIPFPRISWRKDGRMAALAQPPSLPCTRRPLTVIIGALAAEPS